jgi:hypothetical protein
MPHAGLEPHLHQRHTAGHGRQNDICEVSALDYKKIFKDVLVSRTGRYSYTMVPKAGNTTVKHSLWASENEAWGFEASRGDDPDLTLHLKPHAPYVHIGAPGWEQLRAMPDAYLFSVVRNPFRRALSGYLDKGERLGCATFAEHLRTLSRMDPLETDHHFAPQWSIVWPELIRYDAVLALESFPDALRGALASVFGPRYVYASKPHSVQTDDRMAEHYGPAEAALVRSIFAKDFALFGYSEDLGDVALPPRRPVRVGSMTLADVLAAARGEA